MKNALLHRIVNRLGVGGIYKSLFVNRPHCVILAYHRVRPFSEDCLLRNLTVSPLEFEWQIAYLKKYYQIIPLSALDNFLRPGQNKSAKAAIITFDDGYEDNYTFAMPIIKKYHLPASIFVPTAFIDSHKVFWWEELDLILKKTSLPYLKFKHHDKIYTFKINAKNKLKVFVVISGLLKGLDENARLRLLNHISGLLEVKTSNFYSSLLDWGQMKEMLNYKITFGAHTHNHLCLARLNEATLTEELHLSKVLLENRLGTKIEDFAYPYGESSDFDKKTTEALVRQGYKRALTMVQGPVFSASNVFYLKRIGVGGSDTRDTFKLKLSGLIPLKKK